MKRAVVQRLALLALGHALAACSRSNEARAGRQAFDAEAAPAAHVYMGRTIAEPMGFEGAAWLDREDRDATERPEHVLDVLGLKDGDVVADVGAGSGYFTMRLATRVAPHGRVIATDLQAEMLAMIEKKTADARVTNVVTRRATPRDARLPRREIDLVLMVDVYHELPYPRETLAQVRDALRPAGRLALVEYRAEDAVAIKPAHKTTLAQLRKELDASGFVFVSDDESLPIQRIVVFTPRDRSP